MYPPTRYHSDNGLAFLSNVVQSTAMTGPTGHLLSSNESVSHLQDLPLRYDDDTRNILSRDTINLRNSWPNRSLERRRTFQHLLNRCIVVGVILTIFTLTGDLDTTGRSSTDARILTVRRPHVSAARRGLLKAHSAHTHFSARGL